jgi:hydrogenase expression/formation protein HypC
MQIREINGYVANCEARGVYRDVNLFMMQDENLQVDDFVLVHVGYAIQKVSPQEAQTTWELFDELIEAEEP